MFNGSWILDSYYYVSNEKFVDEYGTFNYIYIDMRVRVRHINRFGKLKVL